MYDPFVSCWHSDPVTYTLAGTFSCKHTLTHGRAIPVPAMYTATRVLVTIDTDQIPKILRQPERTCPRTETPVARDVALRNIRGLRAFDAPREHGTLSRSRHCVAPEARAGRTRQSGATFV